MYGKMQLNTTEKKNTTKSGNDSQITYLPYYIPTLWYGSWHISWKLSYNNQMEILHNRIFWRKQCRTFARFLVYEYLIFLVLEMKLKLYTL
jgi:hypothetical protein